jgi:hypothetical protein
MVQVETKKWFGMTVDFVVGSGLRTQFFSICTLHTEQHYSRNARTHLSPDTNCNRPGGGGGEDRVAGNLGIRKGVLQHAHCTKLLWG